MIKLDKWDGTKSYMLISGEPLSAERIKEDHPYGLMSTHVIETDENSIFMFNFWNLNAMRFLYEISGTLTEDEAITEIIYKINNGTTGPTQE